MFWANSKYNNGSVLTNSNDNNLHNFCYSQHLYHSNIQAPGIEHFQCKKHLMSDTYHDNTVTNIIPATIHVGGCFEQQNINDRFDTLLDYFVL